MSEPITITYKEIPGEKEVIEAMALWFAFFPTGLQREKLGELLAAFDRFGVEYPPEWRCMLDELE